MDVTIAITVGEILSLKDSLNLEFLGNVTSLIM